MQRASGVVTGDLRVSSFEQRLRCSFGQSTLPPTTVIREVAASSATRSYSVKFSLRHARMADNLAALQRRISRCCGDDFSASARSENSTLPLRALCEPRMGCSISPKDPSGSAKLRPIPDIDLLIKLLRLHPLTRRSLRTQNQGLSELPDCRAFGILVSTTCFFAQRSC